MLIEKMHNLSNSKAAKFILGLITLSFLVGGMSGYLFSSNDTYAAKVNDEVISQQDFLNRYNQEFEARAQREGEAFMAQSDSPEFYMVFWSAPKNLDFLSNLWGCTSR